MKKSEITPNTIYRIRTGQYGGTPIGFDKFVLTGNEIAGVAYDGPDRYRYGSAKRYIEVYPIEWNRLAGQYVANAGTKQIAFKDIDGDYPEQGAMGDITAEELNRRAKQNQHEQERDARAEVNKTRWAALDTATLDLLNVGEYHRTVLYHSGAGSIQVTLTLDAIETINALLATQVVAA